MSPGVWISRARASRAGSLAARRARGVLAVLGALAQAALGAGACGGPRAPLPPPPAPLTAPAAARVLDPFDDLAPWRAVASDGASAALAARAGTTGGALRLSFDLAGTSGYAVARRALPLDLEGDFELSFALRGELLRNNLEVKLVDESGENVWWFHRRDFAVEPSWRTVRVRKSQIEFAWGPTSDRALRKVAAVEIVISAGQGGGAGWIELDDLVLQPRPARRGPAPAPTAIARRGDRVLGAAAALAAVLDGDGDTWWRAPSAGRASAPLELVVDLGVEHDLVGALVQWRGAGPSRYSLASSVDGEVFSAAQEVRGGGLDPVLLGEVRARFLRVRVPAEVEPPEGAAVAEVVAVDAAPSGRLEPLLVAAAARAPRGQWPRAYLGEQPYWTVVGVDGGARSGLLSEDGALELWPGGPSLEPAVALAGADGDPARAQAATWADVTIAQRLVDGALPIPQVTWRGAGWELEVTALAAGDAGHAELAARYVLRNLGARPAAYELRLGLRPLQVNPPTQFLNIVGGVSRLAELAWSPADGALLVDGRPALRPLAPPGRVALASSPSALRWPRAPVPGVADAPAAVRDPAGLAAAALAFPIALPPGGSYELVITSPLIASGAAAPRDVPVAPSPTRASAAQGAEWFAAALAAMRQSWHGKLERVELRVPARARRLVDTLRSSLAYLLVSRDGPILRPGTRAYARAWIRDGAMISEALLRLGHPAVAAEFLRWFAPHQLPGGKVPCCVDAHGAVAVPEHDSHGQLAFLAHQVYRYGKDRALAREVWPAVAAAMRYQAGLRVRERRDENRGPERAALWGLLPPSISHEGYSARPAYSYWDDFWGLRGLADAAELAASLGAPEAPELAADRDRVSAELAASLRASAARFGQGVIHGAADLGDFDPTSTTIALAPGVPAEALPPELVTATFERAWRELSARSSGERPWTEYTPYELRVPGAFLRLGWRERAHAALEFYFQGQRPPGWNQWPEVLGKDPRAPRFLGDLPHAWVHSDYARTALDLFAYDRDGELVLAAGVLPAWLGGEGVAVRGLPTPWGPLAYSLRRRGDALVLDWSLPELPPGGLVLPWPYPAAEAAPGRATVGRRALALQLGAGASPRAVLRRRAGRLVVPVIVASSSSSLSPPLPRSSPDPAGVRRTDPSLGAPGSPRR